MTNIIHTTGSVQLNTSYATDEQLQDCGLTDWRVATDEEVSNWKIETGYDVKIKYNKKMAIIKEYKDIFNSIDLLYCRKIALNKSTQADYNTARNILQNELTTKLSEV